MKRCISSDNKPLHFALIFVMLTGFICLTLWPWPHNFSTYLPDHFDPPFHAWKLQVIADKILDRHELVPDRNTNIYYPYTNEFYFDALLWPQGLLAALLKAVGCGPILSYNLVFLLFWSLSGFTFYLLLQELQFERIASLFGATIFCLLPYRVSYFVELNMEMVFAIPLFLFFFYKFIKVPSISHGLFLGLSFWLQAVSELYQAICLALVFPLLMLPFVRRFWQQHNRSTTLYLSALLSLSIAGFLCLLFLHPYLQLFSQGYTRDAKEMFMHSLEPLSYLGKTILKVIINPQEHVRASEMIVFPSFSVSILFGIYLFCSRKIVRSDNASVASHNIIFFRWLRLAASGLFIASIFYLVRMPHSDTSNALLFIIGNSCLLTTLLVTLLVAVFPGEDTDRTRFLAGLSAAALFGFILSFGPKLTVMNTHVIADNLLFSAIRLVFPLDGLRVMSRFSVLVMIYFALVSAIVVQKHLPRGRILRWLPLLILVFFIGEVSMIPHGYKKQALPLSSRVTHVIAQHPDNSVLVVPLGSRFQDPHYMLGIAGSKTLLVNGWGGFVPHLQNEITQSLRHSPEYFFQIVRAIWPEPLIVIDRSALSIFHLEPKPFAFNESLLAKEGKCIAEDNEYAVYMLSSTPQTVQHVERFIREDLLRQNPVFSFWAKQTEGTEKSQVILALNKKEVGRIDLTREWQQYRIDIPIEGIIGIDYETLSLTTDKASPWLLGRNEFTPAIHTTTITR